MGYFDMSGRRVKGEELSEKTEEGVILRGPDNINQEFKAEQLTGFSSKIRKKARVSSHHFNST